EQVGQDDHALALVHLADSLGNVLPPCLHIVVGVDTDGLDRFLRPDHMLHRGDELGRKPAVSHQHQSNHCFNSPSIAESRDSPARSSILSFGWEAKSRCRILGVNPAARNLSAISTAAATER